jgi:hypothetical protein
LASVFWYVKHAEKEAFPTEEFIREIKPRVENSFSSLINQGLTDETIEKVMEFFDVEEINYLLDDYKIRELLFPEKGQDLMRTIFPERVTDDIKKVSPQDALSSLKSGKAVTDIQEPERIICALAKEKRRVTALSGSEQDIPFAQRSATILSFWNCYAKILTEHIKILSKGLS